MYYNKLMDPSRKKTLFILDDDLSVLNALKRKFRKSPHTLRLFQSPEELLEQARDESPDLLITDLHLPGVNLASFLRDFCHLHPGSDLILLTGENGENIPEALLGEFPFRKIISKTEEDIPARIGEWERQESSEPQNPPSGLPGGEEEILTLDGDIAPLVPPFLRKREELGKEILRLLGEGKFREIQSLGHKIKGSGRLYGFDRISEIGERIEGEAARGAEEPVRQSAEDLLAYLKRVKYRFD
ncbi:MAG: response regulator [Spirochaetales bacterium]|nr:response regulator [Spirochaetales bacterium]